MTIYVIGKDSQSTVGLLVLKILRSQKLYLDFQLQGESIGNPNLALCKGPLYSKSIYPTGNKRMFKC